MEFPYKVAIPEDRVDEIKTIGSKLRELGKEMARIHTEGMTLRDKLWEKIGEIPGIDLEEFQYEYDSKEHTLECQGVLNKGPEGAVEQFLMRVMGQANNKGPDDDNDDPKTVH